MTDSEDMTDLRERLRSEIKGLSRIRALQVYIIVLHDAFEDGFIVDVENPILPPVFRLTKRGLKLDLSQLQKETLVKVSTYLDKSSASIVTS